MYTNVGWMRLKMKLKDEIKDIVDHWDESPNKTKDINEDIILSIEGVD